MLYTRQSRLTTVGASILALPIRGEGPVKKTLAEIAVDYMRFGHDGSAWGGLSTYKPQEWQPAVGWRRLNQLASLRVAK